jgi:hypothetical protein
MSPSHLASRALALAGAVLACSDSQPPPQPPPGVVYDGPWTPLPEKGDWEDTGPFVQCRAPGTDELPACNLVTPPDPACDVATFGGLERQGAIYRAELRMEVALQANGGGFDWLYRPDDLGFRFDANGQFVGTGSGTRMDSQAFVLGHESGRLSGCRATGPREFTGCFTVCGISGKAERFGSFRAERMSWRQGEAESSGGLQLLSESFVQRGRPVDVYVTKGHAYVVSLNHFTGASGGLTVFDVSDPRRPVLRTSLNLGGDDSWPGAYWNGVWAKGDALYVASGEQGVLVFDISNPALPSFVRALPSGVTDVHTVHVEGDRLYAMAIEPKATFIFDVSTPLQPQLLSRYTLPAPAEPPAYGATPFNSPHDAFAYQGRLYLNHLAGGFAVVDVSAPEQPQLLGRYAYPYVFSHASAVGTFNGRTVAFEGGEGLGAHLRVLDVTDPAHIVKIGEHRLRSVTSIHNMLLVGTKLYVAWYHEGVRVFDVSDPSQPRQVAHFNTYRETDPARRTRMYEGAIGIRVPGDGYVYVIDTARGLLVFNEP